MEILRGDAALRAARELGAASLMAVAINPQARQGQALEVVALGTSEATVLIDARGTPQLATWLASRPLLAAYAAKQVHRALLRTFHAGPTRWACLQLCQTLLTCGEDIPLSLDAIARAHDVPPPPPVEQGLDALADHARLLGQLVGRQAEALKAAGLQGISRIEAAAVAPIAEMEHRGMPFDAAAWETLAKSSGCERQALRQQILLHLSNEAPGNGNAKRDLFGHAALNLDSDSELLATLRTRGCTLPGGAPLPNTRRRTLEQLPEPLGPWLVRYRTLSKLTTAYGTSFLEHVGPDGRLHPTFEQIGASTGRMACHSPNLQAVVKGTAHRACFSTHPSRRLIIADYSACELRILAEMSQDPVFLRAFARGDDLHATVASSIFKKPVSKTQHPALRQVAKAVNFGLAYGMGAAGLARTIHSTPEKARQLLNAYFATFPRIRGFLEGAAREAIDRGYAQTLAGRRLNLRTPPYSTDRGLAERVAKNMPIQGTNADIIKIALANLRRALAPFADTGVVNCVHDEVVVECPEHLVEPVQAALTQTLIQAGEGLLKHVQLGVDVQVTRAWDK